jgi:cytoskeletal protein CcmA (bactofilin family)
MWKRDESVKPSGVQPSTPPRSEGGPADKVVMDLGKSVVIKGELTASEDLTLYGQMEGSVRLPNHTLTIGPHADIKAAISAKAAVIQGAVTGNVVAGEKVEIRATGSVTGDISAPRLVVEEGGHLNGKVEMRRSAHPA